MKINSRLEYQAINNNKKNKLYLNSHNECVMLIF